MICCSILLFSCVGIRPTYNYDNIIIMLNTYAQRIQKKYYCTICSIYEVYSSWCNMFSLHYSLCLDDLQCHKDLNFLMVNISSNKPSNSEKVNSINHIYMYRKKVHHKSLMFLCNFFLLNMKMKYRLLLFSFTWTS